MRAVGLVRFLSFPLSSQLLLLYAAGHLSAIEASLFTGMKDWVCGLISCTVGGWPDRTAVEAIIFGR